MPSASSFDPLSQVDDHLKSVTTTLFNLILQAYDYQGPQSTGPALASTIRDLSVQLSQTPGIARQLQQLPVRSQSGQDGSNNVQGNEKSNSNNVNVMEPSSSSLSSFKELSLPPEVIQYVETGRNPDIYTREFVELTQRNNQHLAGRMKAFGLFSEILTEEMKKGIKGDIAVAVPVKPEGNEERGKVGNEGSEVEKEKVDDEVKVESND